MPTKGEHLQTYKQLLPQYSPRQTPSHPNSQGKALQKKNISKIMPCRYGHIRPTHCCAGCADAITQFNPQGPASSRSHLAFSVSSTSSTSTRSNVPSESTLSGTQTPQQRRVSVAESQASSQPLGSPPPYRRYSVDDPRASQQGQDLPSSYPRRASVVDSQTSYQSSHSQDSQRHPNINMPRPPYYHYPDQLPGIHFPTRRTESEASSHYVSRMPPPAAHPCEGYGRRQPLPGHIPMPPPGHIPMPPPGHIPMSPPGHIPMSPPGHIPMPPPGHIPMQPPLPQTQHGRWFYHAPPTHLPIPPVFNRFTQTTHPAGRFAPPPVAPHGSRPPRMPEPGYVIGEVSSSQGGGPPSTVSPESSVSNWAHNVARAQRRSSR